MYRHTKFRIFSAEHYKTPYECALFQLVLGREWLVAKPDLSFGTLSSRFEELGEDPNLEPLDFPISSEPLLRVRK
jgi:hypothetical protein